MGILAKELLATSDPDSAELRQLSQEASQEALTTVDHTTQTITNHLGMSFMNQLRQLQSELHGVREQNLTTIDFFIVRASTHDEWAGDRDYGGLNQHWMGLPTQLVSTSLGSLD